MRGNFLDIPTDCPQRDERLGWTGDIQVFGPTASFLYDCSGMLTGCLRDLAAEQFARPDRVPPLVVPEALPPGFGVGEMYAVWGDVPCCCRGRCIRVSATRSCCGRSTRA
jgi:alpha-L-rhamnosidase